MYLPMLLLAAALASPDTTSPEPSRQLVRGIYEELVNSNTSYSTGQTTPAARGHGQATARRGLPARTSSWAVRRRTRATWWPATAARGRRRPLLLLAHLDVVEAKREDWSFDPFKLLEKDGYFYGRGTGDDKAQAAIWVANLIRYKQEGFRPKRDLIVALTADEEGGGPFNGVDWLLKNRRDLDRRGVLPERGRLGRDAGRQAAPEPRAGGGEALVELSRWRSATRVATARMPVKENAIYRLAAALQRLSTHEFEFRLNDVTRKYLESLAGLEAEPLVVAAREAAGRRPRGDARRRRGAPRSGTR